MASSKTSIEKKLQGLHLGKVEDGKVESTDSSGVKATSSVQRMKKIQEGFKITYMEMSNVEDGKVLWHDSKWEKIFEEQLEITLPKAILAAKAVSRTMRFSSKEEIGQFRLVQRVLLHGQILEVWNFKVGLVIPNSVNSWQCVIESAGKNKMIPAHILSGNITIETQFYDGEKPIAKATLRVFYK